MTKAEMIHNIVELFTSEIKTSLVNSGVGDFTIRPTEKASKEALRASHDWMNLFIHDYVKLFNATYALCPKDQWENYKMLGLTDLPEIILLRDAKGKLIKAWKSRPTTIRRTYYAG